MAICKACKHNIDDYESVTNDGKPESGAFCICVFCGTIGVIDNEMNIIEAREDQLLWLSIFHPKSYHLINYVSTIIKERIAQN